MGLKRLIRQRRRTQFVRKPSLGSLADLSYSQKLTIYSSYDMTVTSQSL